MINRQDFAWGIMMAAAVLPSVMWTVDLTASAGSDFFAAGTSLILTVCAGTLCLRNCVRRDLCLAPSVPLASFLVYEMIISHGLSRGAVMLSGLTAGIMGLVLLKIRLRFAEFLPCPVRAALPVALGLMLIMTGLTQGRLMFPAADDRYVLAYLSDPTSFFTLLGIVIITGLWSMGHKFGLGWGMLAVAVISLGEGFWAVPPAPFDWPLLNSEWECFNAVSPAVFDADWLLLTLTLLLVMLTETVATAAALVPDITPSETDKIIAAVMWTNVLAACLGCFPLRLAPETAVVTPASRTEPAATRSAYIAVLCLAMCAFCLPLIREAVTFGAIVAPAFVVAGAVLVWQNAGRCQVQNFAFPQRIAVLSLVLVMGFTQDILSALGISVLFYVFLQFMAGNIKKLRLSETISALIFAAYFILCP